MLDNNFVFYLVSIYIFNKPITQRKWKIVLHQFSSVHVQKYYTTSPIQDLPFKHHWQYIGGGKRHCFVICIAVITKLPGIVITLSRRRLFRRATASSYMAVLYLIVRPFCSRARSAVSTPWVILTEYVHFKKIRVLRAGCSDLNPISMDWCLCLSVSGSGKAMIKMSHSYCQVRCEILGSSQTNWGGGVWQACFPWSKAKVGCLKTFGYRKRRSHPWNKIIYFQCGICKKKHSHVRARWLSFKSGCFESVQGIHNKFTQRSNNNKCSVYWISNKNWWFRA